MPEHGDTGETPRVHGTLSLPGFVFCRSRGFLLDGLSRRLFLKRTPTTMEQEKDHQADKMATADLRRSPTLDRTNTNSEGNTTAYLQYCLTIPNHVNGGTQRRLLYRRHSMIFTRAVTNVRSHQLLNSR